MATPDHGERLLISIGSARGTEIAELSSHDSKDLAVYIRCVGDGVVTVQVGGVVTFTQSCERGIGPGTRNVIDFADTDRPLTIVGSVDGPAIWAVAVTEIPPR